MLKGVHVAKDMHISYSGEIEKRLERADETDSKQCREQTKYRFYVVGMRTGIYMSR